MYGNGGASRAVLATVFELRTVIARLVGATSLVIIALLPSGGVSRADPSLDSELSSGTVRVFGDVVAPVTYTIGELQSMQTQTHTVAFETHYGAERHTYTGTPLEEMLREAHPDQPAERTHPLLTIAVVAHGADGYAATLAWGEVLSSLKPVPAFVAWAEDGALLAQPRLVVPGDLGGARYVRELRGLQVVQLVR